MRILVMGDIHFYPNFAADFEKTLERRSGIDTVLVHGDLAKFGSLDEAKQVVESATQLASKKDIPIYFGAGNCDNPELMAFLKELDIDTHGRMRSLTSRRKRCPKMDIIF